MELIEAIRTRRSTRSFKPDPVPRKTLEEILETARWSPNSSNMQSWGCIVLGGKLMEDIKDQVEQKVKEGWDGFLFSNMHPEVPMPNPTGIYRQRSLANRDNMDRHQFPPGTENLPQKRGAYLLKGARFYGAPNAIIVYTETSLYPKSLFDTGLLSQTICLTAHKYGLGTCIMSMVLYWPEIIRERVAVPEGKTLVVGIAIGYPDDAPVNSAPRSREPVDSFTQWFDVR